MKADPLQSVPNSKSTGSEWLEFYITCNDYFGKKVSNQIFTAAWKRYGTSESNTLALRQYLGKNGLKIDTGIVEDIVDTGAGIVNGVADGIGSVLSIGKFATYGIIAVVLLAGVGVAVSFFKHSGSENVGTIAKAAV